MGVIIPRLVNFERLRKMIEIVFYNYEEMAIDLHVIDGENQRQDRNKGEWRAKDNNDMVVVKSEGKSYADLLKEIKQSAKQHGEGLEAKSIKRTRDGNVMIVVDGG